MLKCSESQQQFLDMTAGAANKARLKAQEADKLGLKTLAREWDYFSTAFEKAIERQLRVFEVDGDDRPPEPEPPKEPANVSLAKQLHFT
jgi:hypothetical protein